MDLRELKKRHPFLQELFLPPDFFKECRSAFERGVHGRIGRLRVQMEKVLGGLRNHRPDRLLIENEMDRIQDTLDEEIADTAKSIQRGTFRGLSDAPFLASLLTTEDVRNAGAQSTPGPVLKDRVEQRLREVTRDPWTALK